MHSFNEWLAHWQTFFATVATLAATLAGLLFFLLISASWNAWALLLLDNRSVQAEAPNRQPAAMPALREEPTEGKGL